MKLSASVQKPSLSVPPQNHTGLPLGKIASVFVAYGILGLITAWLFNMDNELLADRAFYPKVNGTIAEIGPLTTQKYNQVYTVQIQAQMPTGSWSFVEGEVLNKDKAFLFSFGKELWDEVGQDSEGTWHESDTSYSMPMTLPVPDSYYIRMGIDHSTPPQFVNIKVSRKNGSYVPHLYFGGILLITGVVINEIRRRKNKG